MPLQRINAGVKVCPPDMNYFNSKKMQWTRISDKNPSSMTVKGRKNFAMSFCTDHLFVSGGMDNGQNLLSEFLVYSPKTALW